MGPRAQTLCEAQRYAEAMERARIFFTTKAARAFYEQPGRPV